jgi:DNA-binding SARP family transcriptional activator/class 3 adenylate cyclase
MTEAVEQPSGTVTFLFSDIEGSTLLVRQLRDRYGELLERHRVILRETFATHGGREVDTQGDSFFVAFARAHDAAAAAIDGQRTLAAEKWPDGVEVRVRMGLHTDEPSAGEGGYHGMGIVRGARICAAARGGQILCSESTRALLIGGELDGATLRNLGAFTLKGLDGQERLHQLVVPGLTDEFVQPQSEKVATDRPRFRLLGPIEVNGDNAPLSLGGRMPKAVLAVLLLHAGQALSVDRLVEVLWGDDPPKTAATSLQNFVAQLRKALGADVLVRQAPGYLLRVEPDELDVNRFARLVSEASSAAPAERIPILHEALGLWRGTPLADFTYEAFAQHEIRRLEDLRLSAIELRIDAELELGRLTEVVGELESLIAKNPLRERLRELLMLALYRSGRQAEALDVYQAVRRLLLEELGLEPGPQLQELQKAIIRQDAALSSVGRRRSEQAEDHYEEVTRALLAGRVVPVLGADVGELALRLAERFGYPGDDRSAMARVSQYIAVMQGSGPLYDELHACLEVEVPPTAVHRFFAALARLLRDRGEPHQLFVTTSYDLALEQALLEAGEEFDVVTYLAAGRHRGRFCHVAPGGTVTVIERPNEYVAELSFDRRTVVLKLHGQVDRTPEREWESFVVTEDDYIDYLAQTDVIGAVPVALAARLRRSHFLFLGYRMSDWNLRVILNRLWGDNPLNYRSWAVQPAPLSLEREFWRRRDVDVLDLPLEDYATALARYVGLEPEPDGAGP